MATAHDPVDTHNRTSKVELEEEDSRTRLVAALDWLFVVLTSNVARYDWLVTALAELQSSRSDTSRSDRFRWPGIDWDTLADSQGTRRSSSVTDQAKTGPFRPETAPFRLGSGPSSAALAVGDHHPGAFYSDTLAYIDSEVHALAKALRADKPLGLVPFIIQGFPLVRVLDLDGSSLGDTGMQTLSELLGRVTWLRSLAILNLRANAIEDAGAKALAAQLGSWKCLLLLDLSGNSIGDEGIKELAAQFGCLTWLESLNLSGNSIGDDGIKELAAQLGSVPHLTSLNLSGNSFSEVSALSLRAQAVTRLSPLRFTIDAPLPECDASARDVGSSERGAGSSEGGVVSSEGTAAPLTPGTQPTKERFTSKSLSWWRRLAADALESRAPPTTDPGAAAAADAVDAKAGPMATVAESPLPAANSAPPRLTASDAAVDAGASTPGAEEPSALSPTKVRCPSSQFIHYTQGTGTAELRVPAATTASVADVNESGRDSADAPSETGLGRAAAVAEAAAVETPLRLPLAAATEARSEAAETAGGAAPVVPPAFDVAARDAVLAFLNGGLQSAVPTAAVCVSYASSGAFTATVRVNPEDFGDAERLAVRFGVRGSFILVADPLVHRASFLTPEFVASALRDLRAPEPSAAFAYSLASKELHRCIEGVTVEYWGGADGLVKLRARVPEEDHAELERAQAVVRRILAALRPTDLIGRGAAAIIIEAVPGSETGLALPSIVEGGKVHFEPRPPAGELNTQFDPWSEATLDDGRVIHIRDAAAAAVPRPAAAPAAARHCGFCGRPIVGGVQAGENGAISLGAYVKHAGNFYAISTGRGLPSPDAIHADDRNASVTLQWRAAGGGKLVMPLRAVHCVDPAQHQSDSFTPFQGSVCTDAMPLTDDPLPQEYRLHAEDTMIADVSIFELLLPDTEHGVAERVSDLQRMALMRVLARKVRVRHRSTVVGLPFWGDFKGDVHFFGRKLPRVSRVLHVCGYSVKLIPILRGLKIVVVSLVNYVARSDHETGCPLAPQNGDSGGAVMQQIDDDAMRLHSFIRARAHADSDSGADRETYYTLTPAQFALQQVKELLLDDVDDEDELVFYDVGVL